MLTLLRLILAFPMIYFINTNNLLLAFITYFLIFLSDNLDGYFARKYNTSTKCSELFDVIVDDIVFYGLTLYLIFFKEVFSSLFFSWLVISAVYYIIVNYFPKKSKRVHKKKDTIFVMNLLVMNLIPLSLLFNLTQVFIFLLLTSSLILSMIIVSILLI